MEQVLEHLNKLYVIILAERQKTMRKLHSGDIHFHDGDPDRGGAGITVVEL